MPKRKRHKEKRKRHGGGHRSEQRSALLNAIHERGELSVILIALLNVGAPLCFVALVMDVWTMCNCDQLPGVHAAEFYAGGMAYTYAVRASGNMCLAFEILLDSRLNMVSPEGFIAAIMFALQVHWGGQALLAPVCSTWVWISRGSTRRSLSFPEGLVFTSCVWEANVMACRTLLIVLLLDAKGVMVILEQPVTSILENFWAFMWISRRIKFYKIRISLNNFGHASTKPVWVYSNRSFIREIPKHSLLYADEDCKTEPPTYLKYVNSKGKVCIDGASGLKGSQEYPPRFGYAIHRVHSDHEVEIFDDAIKTKTAIQHSTFDGNLTRWSSKWFKGADLGIVSSSLIS
jgi:hypothetical protein